MENVRYELITSVKDLKNNKKDYIIARVRDDNFRVELHYIYGEAIVEFGIKHSENYWDDIISPAKWFNKNLSEEKIKNKLMKLYKEYVKYVQVEDENANIIVI